MAYGEYADVGRCGGKLLYQLSKIGIPLTIVESVTFNQSKITYYGKPFASYEWSIDDTPIFTFEGEHERYNKIIKQSKLIELLPSENKS